MERPEYYIPTPGKGGMTELMECCRWCDIGGVKRQLKFGAHPNDQDESGYTALFWICRMGPPTMKEYRKRKRMFRLLIENGASLDVRDIAGETVLTEAKYFAPKPLRRYIEGFFSKRSRASLKNA